MIKVFIFDQRLYQPSEFKFGDAEEQRLNAIKNPKRRLESASALAALSILTKQYSSSPSLDVLRDENGKPFFKDADIPFSLAHSGDISIAAICDEKDKSIGVDVEKILERQNCLQFAERFFNETEKSEFAKSNFSLNSFFRLWTRKEAVAKMTGLGVSEILGGASDIKASVSTKSFVFYNKNDEYCLSVCVNASDFNVEFYNNSPSIKIINITKGY